MNRKVLMLAHFFPPLGGGGVQRTTKFVKYLPSFGWTPVVVTVKEGAYWVSDRTLTGDVPPDVEVVRTNSLSVFRILGWLPGGGKRGRPGQRTATGPTGSWVSRSGGRSYEGSGERSGAVLGVLRKLSSFFLIPDQYVGWVPFATRAAVRRARLGDISVVYSTSSPDSAHLAGFMVARLAGKPWIADFRDPWTERLTFSAPTRVHLTLHRCLEKLVLRNADKIVCTSEDIVSDFTRKYPEVDAGKFVVITNGFDPEDLATVAASVAGAASAVVAGYPQGPGAPTRADSVPSAGSDSSPEAASTSTEGFGVPQRQRDAGSEGKFTITHTGILTGKRNCFGFLEGLRCFLHKRPDARPSMRVPFIGTRDRENEARAKKLGLADVVRFENTLPHLECVRLQSASHVLLLIEDDSYRGSLIYPAKVYEYAASGRPILALLPEGAAARLVRALNAGVVMSPSDPDKIAAALEHYFSHHEAGTPLSGVVDRSLLASFERPALAKKLASLLDELTQPGHHTHS